MMASQTQSQEKRRSIRFPLRLPVEVHAETQQIVAKTENISAGGVLLDLNAQLEAEAPIEFTIVMPADLLGSPTDVTVRCVGRVVRSASSGNQRTVAAIIDEYHFIRR
jgi:PilZ domain